MHLPKIWNQKTKQGAKPYDISSEGRKGDWKKAGRLFMNCGAYSGTIEIDFLVGGKYHFENKGSRIGQQSLGKCSIPPFHLCKFL